MILPSAVLTQFIRVTDNRQTDDEQTTYYDNSRTSQWNGNIPLKVATTYIIGVSVADARATDMICYWRTVIWAVDCHSLTTLHNVLCLVHTTDETRLCCLVSSVVWTESATTLGCFNSPHHISRLDKTVLKFLSPTVLTCRQFCSHRRWDKTVLSCRGCELGIRYQRVYFQR